MLRHFASMNTSTTTSLMARVATSEQAVVAEVEDRRPDTIQLFDELSSAQQEQLVVDAWMIGLRALSNAHRQAQESRLEDVGQALVSDLDKQLKAHVEAQQRTIGQVLGRYFDPQDGHVTQRLRAFVDDHGVLAKLLERYLGDQNSVLAQTLAQRVGEQSELFRKLSPTEADGLVQVLGRHLQSVMDRNHSQMVAALDPLAEDGAVARFVRSLREELKGADEDRAKQLASALAALDANDEGSLISRLARETSRARQDLLLAVNPDAPDSPMASLKQSLAATLKAHNDGQRELLERQRERQEQLDRDIREALARLETRRDYDNQSLRGGLDFEDTVIDFLAAAVQGSPCVLDATGHTTGLRARCKVGDAVVRFTAESAFAGAAVVFEAKRDASYTVARAIEELDLARANRHASAGVFVMARSHAPAAFPCLARHGHNVLVTWDENDRRTDSYLHAAILLGLALVARARTAGDAGDIKALRDIEGRIESEIGRLDKMQRSNEQIRKHSDVIGDEIRKAHDKLDLPLRKAKATLKALNVELMEEEEVERTSPIQLDGRSFEAATGTVAELQGGNGDAAHP
jgi:hypothetical protein